MGGDADTTGAIVGALAGIASGEAGIPEKWISGIKEWPANVNWMKGLANELQMANERKSHKTPKLFWPFLLGRNLLFLIVVLFHGFRRLCPPYG